MNPRSGAEVLDRHCAWLGHSGLAGNEGFGSPTAKPQRSDAISERFVFFTVKTTKHIGC